ncbi:hypothetical protein OG625_05870 [Streptomyces sp. NBC_01351]|uniref:hypothetical protein n=1 Tax=Streptomyces sp. NBC_01351 TaxID=2903833 RepID=UPI002E2F0AF1|nr:hypothetical protein [Streptomyces sp. NBC_01351]
MTDGPTTRLTAEDIRASAQTLHRLAAHLRTGPSLADALPLIASLVDADTGTAVHLGEALRGIARYLVQETTVPRTDTVEATLGEYIEAASVLQDLRLLDLTLEPLRTASVRRASAEASPWQ